MKKYLNSLIAACLAVCLVIGIGLFATACDNVDKDHYVVTVQDEDGNGIANIGVQLCANDGSLLACLLDVYTDANGVSSVDISECVGATNFTIHLNGVPKEYVFEAGSDGVTVYVRDGYSTTITLKKGSAELPNPNVQNLEINLANTSAKQQISPVIETAGLYELRSISPFTVSGEGYNLSDGYYSVLLYLEPDDEFSIGTASNELTFSCYLLKPDENTTDGTQENPHVASAGSAIVLKLGANESANFVNPVSNGNREGANIIVSGNNFKAEMQSTTYTQSFAVAKGRNFSVAAADNTADMVVLSFSSPVNSVKVNLGESKEFSVMLLPSKETLNWITDPYYVEFTVQESGLYKVTVTSEFSDDKISITQTGSNVHYPDKVESSTKVSNTYYAVYELKAGETYRAYVTSEEEADYTTYSEGDTIKYTALVEKYVSAN